MSDVLPPIGMPAKVLPEKEREIYTIGRVVAFLDQLDEISAEHEDLVKRKYLHFIGYPFWTKLVYCQTRPLDRLLKDAMDFMTVPPTEIALKIQGHIRELLSDQVLVGFIQSLPTKTQRRDWLQNPYRFSKKGTTLVHYTGTLVRVDHERY